MSEEYSFSDVSLNVIEEGKELLNVTTGQSFFVAVYDEKTKECSGRMSSSEAGISFIEGAIACFLETMLRNGLNPEESREALHQLVDDVVDDYRCSEDTCNLN